MDDNTNNTLKYFNEFIQIFKDPNGLKLDSYTAAGENRDDFTYWIERKLDNLGGIKGGSSYKFGIYKYKKKPEDRNGYMCDGTYAWVKKYGETADEAFEYVKNRICNIYQLVCEENINYDKLGEVAKEDAYMWKIAFLYSNKRLVNVYKQEVLEVAAKRLGIEVNGEESIASLQKSLMEYYNKNKKYYDNDVIKFGSKVWNVGTTELLNCNQLIKYGAPGTGKTFTAKKDAEFLFENWKIEANNQTANFSDYYEFVQFHPSYSYEDFIEGIKPVLVNGKTELKLRNGIFKSFCKKSAKYELWLLENGLIPENKLEEITVKDVKEKIKNDNPCPFHFPDNAKDEDLICKYIPPYFFLIDEINRADLSRVFGELMYCLEYRGYSGRIKTQYSEMEQGDTIFYAEGDQHYFFIPENVYIIGTMNTIDRSIESFDFALRRRFMWQRVVPNENVLKEYFNEICEQNFVDKVINAWKTLNKEIESLLGEDYQIGHSYLMKLDKYSGYNETSYRKVIWEKHINPILEEYFRGSGNQGKEQIEKLSKKFFNN